MARWNKEDIPHKGWKYRGTRDLYIFCADCGILLSYALMNRPRSSRLY